MFKKVTRAAKGNWKAVDVGTVGRRAIALIRTDGIAVMATDATVAGQAMAVVFESLLVTKQIDPRLKAWALELRSEFPALPDANESARECTRGNNAESTTTVLGYGYVKPTDMSHECGGALFDPKTHNVREIAPRRLWLAKGHHSKNGGND